MKIIGIGRNYQEHIKELNNEVPDAPIIFFKPDTALLTNNEPFYYPSFSKSIHHEVELVLKISKEGKNIDEKFASRYFEEIGLGIDFTARDLQKAAAEKGLPWAIAKGFNGSAPVSGFLPVSQLGDLQNLAFRLEIDGEKKQEGNSKYMIHTFPKIISYVSKFITLKKGDLIFTGTPAGVGEVKIGNRLEAFLGDIKMLSFEIK